MLHLCQTTAVTWENGSSLHHNNVTIIRLKCEMFRKFSDLNKQYVILIVSVWSPEHLHCVYNICIIFVFYLCPLIHCYIYLSGYSSLNCFLSQVIQRETHLFLFKWPVEKYYFLPIDGGSDCVILVTGRLSEANVNTKRSR